MGLISAASAAPQVALSTLANLHTKAPEKVVWHVSTWRRAHGVLCCIFGAFWCRKGRGSKGKGKESKTNEAPALLRHMLQESGG